MKNDLTTILEAMRAAQAEVADYLVSADRNAELTIAKLVGIPRASGGRQGHGVAPRLRGPKQRTATNVSRGKLTPFAGTTLCETISYSAMRHEECVAAYCWAEPSASVTMRWWSPNGARATFSQWP